MTDSGRTADSAPMADGDGAAQDRLADTSLQTGIPPTPALPPDPDLPPAAARPPELAGAKLVQRQTERSGGATIDLESETLSLDGEMAEPESAWEQWRLQAPSMLTSTVLHLLLVLLLALMTSTQTFRLLGDPVMLTTDPGSEAVENAEGDLMGVPDGLETKQALTPGELSALPADATMNEVIGPIMANLGTNPLLPKIGGGGGLGDGEGIVGGTGDGNGLELRLDGANRAAMLRSGGGTPQSEKAVLMALGWLAEHQNSDGSWSYDHRGSPRCHEKCNNPGTNASKIAATAMALLPFLGTGQTHREGEFRKNIDQGIKYLVRSMRAQREGSLWDPHGTMYGHGLASIVLCEAYGMTHDPALQTAAQSAINFIVYAQDPAGGGWRYNVQTPGDTSVAGWQLMALKSAQMAYLRVPPATMRKAGYFLDYVQSDRGAVYGYLRPENRRAATTAIGLLCRMYLGWEHDHDPLKRGVQILSQLGPSIDTTGDRNNMYYNYYATQVMHHYGGYPWQRWNSVMREYLVRTQSADGHEAGSWFLDGSDEGAHAGGRLYCTAMAAMTLEVYYRYMPLYRPQLTKKD